MGLVVGGLPAARDRVLPDCVEATGNLTGLQIHWSDCSLTPHSDLAPSFAG